MSICSVAFIILENDGRVRNGGGSQCFFEVSVTHPELYAYSDSAAKGCAIGMAARKEASERLIDRFRQLYDVTECCDGELICRAEFHSTSESYVLTKNAELWSHDDNEYVFIFSGECLNAEDASERIERTRAEGMERIVPKDGHRTSDITTIFVYDVIQAESKRIIGKYSFRKNYALMFRGWTDHRVGALELSTGDVLTNRAGRSLRKILQGL